MDNVLPIVCITVAALIVLLIPALNLKLWVWITNVVAGHTTIVPGIFKACGLVLLMGAAVAALDQGSLAAVHALRPPSPNSWEAARGITFFFVPLLSYFALTWMLAKFLPTSVPRALLIAFIHACFMLALCGALFFLVIFIAFSQYH